MQLEEDCSESDCANKLHQPSTSQSTLISNNARLDENSDVSEVSEDRTSQDDEHKTDAEYNKYYADSKYCYD